MVFELVGLAKPEGLVGWWKKGLDGLGLGVEGKGEWGVGVFLCVMGEGIKGFWVQRGRIWLRRGGMDENKFGEERQS